MGKERLNRLADRQHGLFARPQALALGVTAKEVEHGCRAGRWHRLRRGVYRMAGAPRCDLQALLPAVLAAGPGAVASHRGAAWLWGLAADLRLDVSGPLQRSLGADVTVHRRAGADLRPVIRRGVPCTDPLRTVLDLAALGDAEMVERALDLGIARGLFTAAGVGAALGRRSGQGRRGVLLLRACLLERLGGAGERPSALESAMDRVVVRHRLPPPARQHRLAGTRYRLDYAWPDALVAVEVDGYDSHSALEAFRHDRARQNVLVLAGWTVLRFTWDDVTRRPAQVADQIRRALSARRPA